MGTDPKNASHRPALQLEHILLIAFLVAAFLAGGGLFFLKKTHDRQTSQAATENVLHRGVLLVNMDALATLGAACSNEAPTEIGKRLSETADHIFAVRPEVQSLSITRGGVTVLQRQAHGLDSLHPPPLPEDIEAGMTFSPSTLEIGGRGAPVFVLTKTAFLDDGTPLVIEAAIKRGAVGQEEQTAREAIASLSRFSIAVLALSFTACAVVLTLAVIRDRRREQRARQEEHLAFSGVLANGILHDFRNPMSAVRLDAQMLEREMARAEGFRPERVTELAGRIAHAMARMDKVFQEFLFLAKPDDERPERVNVAQAIKECCETLAPRIEQSGVNVRFAESRSREVEKFRSGEIEKFKSGDEETSQLLDSSTSQLLHSSTSQLLNFSTSQLQATAFPFALRRALLNVLVNALQFAPRGSEVEIALNAAHGRVVVEVRDRGPGIPADQRKRVFEMFVTTRPEGTGLGLFLARTSLRRCGGDIEALPRPGGGTVIRISLPESKPPD